MLGYAISGAVALAGATFAGFHTMWPTSQLYGRTVIGIDPGTRLLALTYDDGPDPRNTPALLEVLARHDAHATFFMLGRHVAAHPRLARQVADAGHAIGNHTHTHPNLIFCSAAQIAAQIDGCAEVLQQTLGTPVRLFRPPFGGRTPRVLRIARAKGYTLVMWRVVAYDWNPDPAEVIVSKITRQVRGGDVILLHDGGHLTGADRSATVAATDALVTRYAAEGYRFVTVPELLSSAKTR